MPFFRSSRAERARRVVRRTADTGDGAVAAAVRPVTFTSPGSLPLLSPHAGIAWDPIAAGASAGRVWHAIDEIAAGLRGVAAGPGAPVYPGLAGGNAGVALFFHSLHAATGAPEDADAARRLLGRAVGAMEVPGPSFCLFRGAPGVAWALAHLHAGAADFGEAELEAVDQALLAAVRGAPDGAPFDLARGMVGLGVYALERLSAPAAADALEAIVAWLERTAERPEGGAAWFRRPEWLRPWQRERFPLGVYDLGMAHGAAGVVALLARVVAAGVAAGRARGLLDGAVRWLRSHELPLDSPSRYPARMAPGQPPRGARLAWCYGDPGVGLALLAAARATGDGEMEAHARGVLRAAAARDRESAQVADAPFCHGAAGAFHLFHRAAWATGDPAPRRAALRWLEVTLGLDPPGPGVSPLAFRVMREGVPTWSLRTGVLEGLAGVGLALLASVTPVEPAWDRIFLVDVAPPPHTPHAAPGPARNDPSSVHLSSPQQTMNTAAAPDLLAPAHLVDRAGAIADALLAAAEREPDGALTWHRGYDVDFAPAADAGIFNGRIGEALFFAALFATTGNPAHEEAALRATRTLRDGAGDGAFRERLLGRIRYGLTGVGSQVYGLVRMSQFLDRPALLGDAARLADVLTPAHIAGDRVGDVFWGVAGAALGLLALYDHTGDGTSLARAVACGDHLLAARGTDPETGLRAWATLEPALFTGFAHGSSGIAHALLRLHQATGEPRFYDAAIEAFAWERTIFREEVGDWPDTRDQPVERKLISAWCHGAPGIALSRLTALHSLADADQGDVAEDLDRALTRTSEAPVHGADYLCCGNLGRVDILLEAGRVLENDSLVRQARKLAEIALGRADEDGWVLSPAPRPHMEGGLWQGMAGIGYELLRISDPELYPSLLNLS